MGDEHIVTIDQLQVGLYVHLDLKWFEHAFAFSHFKIKGPDQIEAIRALGLKAVRISPELSDVTVPAAQASADTSAAAAATPGQGDAPDPAESTENAAAAEASAAMQAKLAMLAEMRERREAAERIERAFLGTAQVIRDIERNLFSRPEASVAQATTLVGQIVDSILTAPELAIQVMGDLRGGEELYFHSLNVTMLAMMMARDIGMPKEVAAMLGLGAMLHDVGHKEIPDRVLRKDEPLTQAERHLYEMHVQYGVTIGQKLKLPSPALTIVREHHEAFDGSGYPGRLKGESSHVLARIVAIANHYDELCNPLNIDDAMTPHEALSLMFARQRGKFDPKLLQVFIRCLGVYPPGTIVQLSNGVIGMVVTVNTSRPMKPTLVIYDGDVPRDEAIMLDMDRETEVNVTKAIRPAQVPREVYQYLSPRKRMSYYFEPTGTRAEPA